MARLFGYMKRDYLIKSYMLSFIFTGFFWIVFYAMPEKVGILPFVFFGVLGLLYPFSLFVWDSMVYFFWQDHIRWYTTFDFWLGRILKWWFLYFFTGILAPIGIIYILIKTKRD